MNRETPRARRAPFAVALFGTASFLTLTTASAFAAAAPAAAPGAGGPAPIAAGPVEEVLITGSLIAGAPAVGVPVTALGQEDFYESGAVTISEMLLNVPAIEGNVSVNTVEVSGSNRQRFQNAEIHGIGGQSTATLLLIDGMRHPQQGTNLENVDPSIIPSLAIDRIDVLAAGASAVYGSDAVAGVINVILRHNYNGAISQVRGSMSTDLGWDSARYNAAQLFGRTWDNLAGFGEGGFVFNYEWWDQSDVKGNRNDAGRPYQTTDFQPFGFDDRTPLASSFPGVVSTGNPAATLQVPTGGQAVSPQRGDIFCSNCYLVPTGAGWNFGDQAPGPTTSWTALLANKQSPGHNNFVSPYAFSNLNPAAQANFVTLTFDQDIVDDFLGLGPIAFFLEGYHMNRRYETTYPGGYSPSVRTMTPANGVTVPTNNPYRPSGVPAGTVIRAHYNLMKEFPSYATEGSLSQSYSFGFNFDALPFDWHGKVFYHAAEEYSWSFMRNLVNPNAFDAAVGNTIASIAASGTTPLHAAYTKPANVPYLNLFCDALVYQCNSPATLNFIRAFRDDNSTFNIRQVGLNIDGPLFDPGFIGGPILGAIGAEKLSQDFSFRTYRNETAFHPELVSDARQYNKEDSYAVFGQLNVPIVTERNELPLIHGFLLELGYRYDDYYYSNNKVKTPKIAANWDLGYGLVARGAYGQSFNTAPFGLVTNYVGYRERHGMINKGFLAGSLTLNCPTHAGLGNANGGVVPGSLQAFLNPNRIGCPASPALGLPAGPPDTAAGTDQSKLQPVGFDLGPSLFALRGEALGPETSDQWSLGFHFQPAPDDRFTGFLAGFNADVSWWHIQRENLIQTINAGEGVNDPHSFSAAQTTLENADPFTSRYIVIPRPDLTIDAPENAAFKAIVDSLIASGKADFDPTSVPFVKFINISSIFNAKGFEEFSGIDFDLRYDWDMGNLGAFGLSATGYYQLRHRTQAGPGQPINDDYTTIIRGTNTVEGANSGHQLQRARFNLRWTDMMGAITTNIAANWIPHRNATTGAGAGGIPPACFWRDDFAPGSAWALQTGYPGCYPGSPFFPQPAKPATPADHTDVGDQRYAGMLQPSQIFFDFTIAYDTRDTWTNTYLQNLRFTLNVNNVLNRLPSAIDYDARTASGSQRIREGNPFQRTVSFTITKTW
jgi:outer membrane receptor protein involved in Fe transport